MQLMSRRMMLGGTAAMAVAATLAACSKSADKMSDGGDTAQSGGAAASGSVYFLNFKPEAEEAFKTIAEAYTKKTGVPVKVFTAASGNYEQTLTSEVAKSEAPTLFNINGPVGLANWQENASDLTNSKAVKALTDPSFALKGQDGKIYGVPLATEGYGLIYNKAILDKYFAMADAKAKSVDEIKGFAKLKEVAEDMQAKKADLGIDGVFAATSLAPGEDWRFQTHLANYPVYYEYRDLKATDAKELKLTYSDNYKQIFDLYLNNSTINPAETSGKAVTDSMAEFALGKVAFVQNGNWAWSQISEVEGNTVKEEDIHFMPIYVGVEGEDKSGIAVGTENYLTINAEASEDNRKATQDFLDWLFTDAEGAKMLVDKSVVSVAPYKAFADLKPADPLGKEVLEYINKADLYPVNWVFQTFPSQDFKDQLGQHLAQYASGKEDWNAVKDYFVSNWASEKSKL
ncbi:ABC transporter substrate-binding protein [Actinomyces trachealis]|uniref:ABC transporter substrate-binding protein n=1 Tax=Actinomyces trachealis TaxID=2763540 RepID=UPI001892D202|nr:ABC transporter substrate-binding protein [Actinomyces trachealis]